MIIKIPGLGWCRQFIAAIRYRRKPRFNEFRTTPKRDVFMGGPVDVDEFKHWISGLDGKAVIRDEDTEMYNGQVRIVDNRFGIEMERDGINLKLRLTLKEDDNGTND